MRAGFAASHGQLGDGPGPAVVAELNRDVVVSDFVQTRVVDRLPLAPLGHLAMPGNGAGAKPKRSHT